MPEALNHPFILTLGTWLLHFAWQGALYGLALVGLLRLAKNAVPEVRYTLCWLAMVLMLLTPTVTTLATAAFSEAGSVTIAEEAPVVSPSISSNGSESSNTLEHNAASTLRDVIWPRAYAILSAMRPYLVLCWLLGVAIFAFRLGRGCRHAHLLKSAVSSTEAAPYYRMLYAMSRTLHLRQKVALKLSNNIDQPLLIGWLKPVILLPASIVTGLHPEQVKAILAHELAHVRRHDYLFSLVQSILETLFFFHPTVWWISNQIRIEREYCCDQLAVQALGGKKLYLNTLVQLESFRLATPQLSLAMNDGSLLDRIHRITQLPQQSIQTNTNIMSRISVIATLLIFGAFTVLSTGSRAQADAVQQAAPAVNLDDVPSIHPLKNKTRVTSNFGMRMHPILKEKKMHNGIDFLAPSGTPVYSTANGTVKTVAEGEAHGKYIVITHADGHETLYSALSLQSVQEGDAVNIGDQIGETGNSGLSTAPHLHYEVHLNGKHVNPIYFIPPEMIGAVEKDDIPSANPLMDDSFFVTGTFGVIKHPILKINRLHPGVDFVVDQSTPVYATANGTIDIAEHNSGLGKHIKINHEAGYKTTYGHLSEIAVSVGDVVHKGDLIGRTGNTGLSAAPHLHYEVRLNGKAVDPEGYLPAGIKKKQVKTSLD